MGQFEIQVSELGTRPWTSDLATPIRDAEKDLLLRMMPFRCNVQTTGVGSPVNSGMGSPPRYISDASLGRHPGSTLEVRHS